MKNSMWNVCGMIFLCSCAGVFKKAELPWKANGELALPASFEILEPSTQVRIGNQGKLRLVGDCESPDQEPAQLSGDIVESGIEVPCRNGKFEVEVQLTPGDGFKAVLFSYTFLLTEKRNQVIDLWLDTQGPDGPNLDLAAQATGRVGKALETRVPLFGNCTNPRETILIRVNDQDFQKTTCRSDYRFNTEVDISGLADGKVTIELIPFDAYGNAGSSTQRLIHLDRSLCQSSPKHSHFHDGSGTPSDPFVLCSASQFERIFTDDVFLGAHYVLGDNIEFASGWRKGSLNSSGKPFKGSLNGRHYSILSYRSEGSSDVSLFGSLEGASLSDFAILDSEVESQAAGPLLATHVADSKIERLYIQGLVRSGDSGSGLVTYSSNSQWSSISSQIDLSAQASELANWFFESRGDTIEKSGVLGSIFGAKDVVAGLSVNVASPTTLKDSFVAPQVLADENAMHWGFVFRGSDDLNVEGSYLDIERHPANDAHSKAFGLGSAAFRHPQELGWGPGWQWRERDFHPIPVWLDWN